MAMEERTGGSGNASSLLGLFQFILGGLVSPLVGLKGQYNVMPYLTVIVITAILIVLLQFYILKISTYLIYSYINKRNLASILI